MTNQISTLLMLLAVLGLVRPLRAQDVTTGVKRPSPDQIKNWVAELANLDPKPFTEPYVLKPPRNVNHKSLMIVKNAYDELAANVSEALPALIDSLEDDRYSYYQESTSGAFICHSVGDACYSILVANIEIYHKHTTVLDRTDKPRTLHFIAAMGGPKKWLAERKSYSLFEMQREAIEWALKQPKPEPRTLVSDEDWNKCTKKLRHFYDAFVKAASPVVVKNELWFEGK